MIRIPYLETWLGLAVALAASSGPVLAADFDLPDGQFVVGGAVGVGTAIRTEARNSELIVAPNAAVVGVTGAAVGSKNGDDGNLNYGNGDTVSRAVKGTIDLGYRRGNLGIVAGAKAWYDSALKNQDVPFGNNPNNYLPNTPLSDDGFAHDAKFSGVDLTHLYAFGRSSLGTSTLDWKAGMQVLDWSTARTAAQVSQRSSRRSSSGRSSRRS